MSIDIYIITIFLRKKDIFFRYFSRFLHTLMKKKNKKRENTQRQSWKPFFHALGFGAENRFWVEIRRSSQLRTLLKRVVVNRTWKKDFRYMKIHIFALRWKDEMWIFIYLKSRFWVVCLFDFPFCCFQVMFLWPFFFTEQPPKNLKTPSYLKKLLFSLITQERKMPLTTTKRFDFKCQLLFPFPWI